MVSTTFNWPLVGGIYLLIGGLAWAVMLVALKVAEKHRDHEPEMEAALRHNDQAIGSLPGGRVTACLLIVLLWPVAVGFFVLNRRPR